MKRVYLKKPKIITVDDIRPGDIIGFTTVFAGDEKDFVVKVSDDEFVTGNPTKAYETGKMKYKSIHSLLSSVYVNQIFLFESNKELYQWLAED